MATRCLVGDIFPEIKFDNITLRTVGNPELRFISGSGYGNLASLENPEEISTQISINCSLREQISAAAHPWYQQGDILQPSPHKSSDLFKSSQPK
jgi:hypothetical protein